MSSMNTVCCRFTPLDNAAFDAIKIAFVRYIHSEYTTGQAESSAPCAYTLFASIIELIATQSSATSSRIHSPCSFCAHISLSGSPSLSTSSLSSAPPNHHHQHHPRISPQTSTSTYLSSFSASYSRYRARSQIRS
jgi:hypothetical protein